MGLGIIEESEVFVTIRCSTDPDDFALDDLLERLQRTGATMRGDALRAFEDTDSDLARQVLNRERQSNKVFVLALRLVFAANRTPDLAESLGLDSNLALVGYRSVAKNLELTADAAEGIARVVVDADNVSRAVPDSVNERLQEFAARVDDLSALAVSSAVKRSYDKSVEVRRRFRELTTDESRILNDLPELSNEEFLAVQEMLVNMCQIAEYAVRNAEIAANLALSRANKIR